MPADHLPPDPSTTTPTNPAPCALSPPFSRSLSSVELDVPLTPYVATSVSPSWRTPSSISLSSGIGPSVQGLEPTSTSSSKPSLLAPSLAVYDRDIGEGAGARVTGVAPIVFGDASHISDAELVPDPPPLTAQRVDTTRTPLSTMCLSRRTARRIVSDDPRPVMVVPPSMQADAPLVADSSSPLLVVEAPAHPLVVDAPSFSFMGPEVPLPGDGTPGKQITSSKETSSRTPVEAPPDLVWSYHTPDP